MKQSDPTRGEHPSLPPFFAAVAAWVFLLFAGSAQAAVDPTVTAGQPARIVLTLEQAIGLTLRGNRNIAKSQYGAESQRHSIDAARAPFELKLIPTGGATLSGGDDGNARQASAGLQLQKKLESGTLVSLGPQVTRSSGQSARSAQTTPPTGRYATNLGVTVTQPILRGRGKEFATDPVRSADAAYRTSRRNVYQTTVNSVLETISAYYDAILRKGLMGLHEKTAARLSGHSEIARAREKVGLTTPMDTYRAELPLREAEESMITASQAFQDAKDRLKLLLALPQDTDLDLVVPGTPEFRESSLKDAVDTALARSVEIEQLDQELAEAKRKAALAKHNTLPDLDLVAGYDRYAAADTFGRSASLDHDRYTVSVMAGTDLFRTAEKAAYEQSLIGLRTVATNTDARKEEVSRQVRKQWLSLQEAGKKMAIRKSQIRQGEEKIALAEVKFSHGMADNFDVIESEKELQGARADLLAAEIEYAVGVYNLKAILGVLVPRTE
jgi:outer membrane protein TolC